MNDIQSLLERYYNAETSPEEEAWLRDQLAAGMDIADPASAALLQDVSALRTGVIAAPRSRRYLWWGTVPAAAAAALLVFWPGIRPAQPAPRSVLTASLLADQVVSGEIKDEALALEQARKALQYVSVTLNKGARQIGQLEQLEIAVDKIKKESL